MTISYFRNLFPIYCLIIVLIISGWSAINPHDRFTWYLEVLPVFIGMTILLATYARFPLTNLLYALLVMHAIILLIGGHYTYARVPLFDLLRDQFHLSRNHFDRVGHFAQGFVPAIIIRELLIRTSPLKPGKWLITLILFSCLGISAAYEILEWAVATLTGEASEAFLGTQGDTWDTQKDMLLALLGAATALLTLSKWHDTFLEKLKINLQLQN